MSPYIISQKDTVRLKVIAIESRTFTDLNYIHLYYYKTRIVSVEGELYYTPYGRLEFIGMVGQYEFIDGQVYEIRYKPVRKNQRGINHFVEAKELTA